MLLSVRQSRFRLGVTWAVVGFLQLLLPIIFLLLPLRLLLHFLRLLHLLLILILLPIVKMDGSLNRYSLVFFIV